MKQKYYPDGFSVIELVLIVAVLGLIGFGIWFALNPKKKDEAINTIQTQVKTGGDNKKDAAYVAWEWNGNAWRAMGDAPKCETPLKVGSPVEISNVTAKLWPGQVRGGDFKPHGGLSVENASSNKLEVKAMRDAYLYRGSRYIEQGETQYLFDFLDSCGVMYRFDHLSTLSGEFAKYADALPAAKADDSRTEKISSHPLIKAGTTVATEVGFAKTKNVFVDVGVYDLRVANEASKTSLYQTDSGRMRDKEQSFYALCWFNLLPSSDKAAVEKLPARDGSSVSASDYCK